MTPRENVRRCNWSQACDHLQAPQNENYAYFDVIGSHICSMHVYPYPVSPFLKSRDATHCGHHGQLPAWWPVRARKYTWLTVPSQGVLANVFSCGPVWAVARRGACGERAAAMVKRPGGDMQGSRVKKEHGEGRCEGAPDTVK